MSGNESMKRSHNAAMSLVLATILHAAPAQVFAQTAGSYDKIKKHARESDVARNFVES